MEPYSRYSALRSVLSGRMVFCLLFCLAALPLYSVHTAGNISISVFTKADYGAGTQNWDIERDDYGRIYVANNEGLLVNNGIQWTLYPVPNHTILRSIAFGAEGRLYAGAQDEFGYFSAGPNGTLVYTSLKKALPAAVSSFADIWNIEIRNNEVFFMASEVIFRYKDNKLSYFKPETRWTTLKKHQNHLIAQDARSGLMVFSDGGWRPWTGLNQLPPGFQITDIKPFKRDTSVVSTSNHGLYLWTRNTLAPLIIKGQNAEKHFTSLYVAEDGNIIAGTYSAGLYKIDRAGNILNNVNTTIGLISNTIRCVFGGFDGYTWTATDNGIAQIDWNNPISHINPKTFNNGSGQAAVLLDGNIYFALSTGLQRISLGETADLIHSGAEPEIIMNGLTWNLQVWQNTVIAGRDDGLWAIQGNKAINIADNTGYWTFMPIPGSDPVKIAAGHYSGIRWFGSENGRFTDLGNNQNFFESSRYMVAESEGIWVSHPYHGLFKIDTHNKGIRKYTREDGLPGELNNNIFQLQGRPVLATNRGIYEFDKSTGRFIPSRHYRSIFGDKPVRYLKEDLNGNIWFVQGKMLGVVDLEGKKPVIHYIPELQNHILSGFENILSYDRENVLVGSDLGFYNINYARYKRRTFPYITYISSVRALGKVDSVIFGGFTGAAQGKSREYSISYQTNSVLFSFASSFISSNTPLEFSYYLEGYEKGWSNWSREKDKEYTNLKEGHYVFHLKCRNGPSNEFAETTFIFSIEPPWYRTIWAYVLYILVFVVFVMFVLKIQKSNLLKKENKRAAEAKRKFEEEQQQLKIKHQLKLEKKEKAIIELRNEKLQAEIRHKNEELASAAMNLLQNKAFLGKIAAELNKVYLPLKDKVDTTEIRKILRRLSSEEKLDEEWKQFSIHFNSVNNDFLITLKKAYPELNANDMKLCTYLRMNLSSKEIAQLLNISVRGVEISRYRLRKKLKLESHQDLFDFLLNIQLSDREK